jgi:hypothetical protein
MVLFKTNANINYHGCQIEKVPEMRNDTPFVDAVPNGALEEIAAVQEDGVGLFLADGPRLVDESRVSAEALASSCLGIGAGAAVFVGLLETTVDVVGVQDRQIQRRHGIHQRHEVKAYHSAN